MRTGVYAIEFIMEDGFTNGQKVYVINSSRNIDRDYLSTINKISKGKYENTIFTENKVNINRYKFTVLEEIKIESYAGDWKGERAEKLEELKEEYTEKFISDGHMVIDKEKTYLRVKPQIIVVSRRK